MHRKSVLLLLSLIVFAGAASAADLANVSAFSPQGTVKKVRQVRSTFSEAMLPFGDPGAAMLGLFYAISSPANLLFV